MDFNLVFVLSKLSGTTMKDMVTLLDRVPAPAKVARFKKLSAFLADEHAKSIAVDFCRKHAGVLTIRNHLTHGFWGLYSADGVKKYVPACYFPENTKGLIFATQLPAIVSQTSALQDILAQFISLDESSSVQGMRGRKTYMGYGPPEGQYAAPQGSYFLDLQSLGHSKQ